MPEIPWTSSNHQEPPSLHQTTQFQVCMRLQSHTILAEFSPEFEGQKKIAK